MDSIAAPIGDIQFPTVTACQSEKRQPDRWAFLETVLNFVKLSYDLRIESRQRVENVREDFRFLIKFIGDNLKGWSMFNHITRFQPILNDCEASNQIHIIDSISNLTSSKKLSILNLFQLPLTYFSVENNLEEIIVYGLNISSEDLDMTCKTSKCKKKHSFASGAIQWLCTMTQMEPENMAFGSFVTKFLPEMEYFGYDGSKRMGIISNTRYCKKLTKEEKLLSNFFTQLSGMLGLKQNEIISLHDLSVIFGILPEDIMEQLTILVKNYYLYAMCQENSDFVFVDEMECIGHWISFLEDGNYSGNYDISTSGKFPSIYQQKMALK